MRVYISGKITGDPHYRMRFLGAALPLLALGHEVLNPAVGGEGLSDTDAMRRGVRMLLTAEAVVMLENWEDSRGARAEHALAERLELPIIYARRSAPCAKTTTGC